MTQRNGPSFPKSMWWTSSSPNRCVASLPRRFPEANSRGSRCVLASLASYQKNFNPVHVQDKTFRYTFLPLSDMSAFGNGITRHHEAVTPTSPDAFTTHVFPFATLPQLTSRVHPTFVIMHLADLIFNHSMNSFLQSLRCSNRTVGKVVRLYPAWARQASSWADVGPSFVTVPISENNEGVEGPEGDLDSGSSDGDSTCTPPYRLGYAPRIVRRPPYPRVKNHTAESDDSEEDEASQSELRRLHPETTEIPAQYGWTKNSISEWARVCSDS